MPAYALALATYDPSIFFITVGFLSLEKFKSSAALEKLEAAASTCPEAPDMALNAMKAQNFSAAGVAGSAIRFVQAAVCASISLGSTQTFHHLGEAFHVRL
jgi:hypothetical protein